MSDIRDSAIVQDAQSRIRSDPHLGRQAISVAVEDGWLTLSGEVDSEAAGYAAEHRVRWLEGVCGVCNRLTVSAPIRPAGQGPFAGTRRRRAVIAMEDGRARLDARSHCWFRTDALLADVGTAARAGPPARHRC
jgi:osmotically-inducible protein OsmY